MDARHQDVFTTADGKWLVQEAYLAHAPALRRYIRSLVRDPAAADDLAQEAFLRLAREVQIRTAPDNVPAWLFRVGANLVASRARHAAVVARTPEPRVAGDGGPRPEVVAEDAERAAMLHGALARLARDHRRALILAAEGYRGPEIAAILGRSPLATRALLCRARSRMRSQLLADGFEC
jgi:RNA polymerase sigma-70 factor, ECF subfamily